MCFGPSSTGSALATSVETLSLLNLEESTCIAYRNEYLKGNFTGDHKHKYGANFKVREKVHVLCDYFGTTSLEGRVPLPAEEP